MRASVRLSVLPLFTKIRNMSTKKLCFHINLSPICTIIKVYPNHCTFTWRYTTDLISRLLSGTEDRTCSRNSFSWTNSTSAWFLQRRLCKVRREGRFMSRNRLVAPWSDLSFVINFESPRWYLSLKFFAAPFAYLLIAYFWSTNCHHQSAL